MIRLKLPVIFLFLAAFPLSAWAQSKTAALAKAFEQFENDVQMQSAIASIYVCDEKGTLVFEKWSSIGLAPASTQKIITAATAYALLGKDYRYKTVFGLGSDAALYIKPSGDPTLGSERWAQTKRAALLAQLKSKMELAKWNGTIVIDTTGWDGETIPGGWIWEDIGNYYGAGANAFNWRENQYDVYLQSGSKGSSVKLLPDARDGYRPQLFSKLIAGAPGSGDNAYIYYNLHGDSAVIRGTIPAGSTRFSISGAQPFPEKDFAVALAKSVGFSKPPQIIFNTNNTAPKRTQTITSPPLDSLIFWFNRRSINLYGEALLKTIGYKLSGHGDTETGMGFLKSFWKKQGIKESALNLVDGSGLSPLNRVTSAAQAKVLLYALQQPWFEGFYLSLPVYNGMKLKSGTINGVKAFAGYHTAASGKRYVIAFIVNNYNGSSTSLVNKMYAVLDVLQ